jgi:release factor glutamine methyltransferase
MTLIYSPAEDSFLLKKVLEKEIPQSFKKNKNITFLEIGVGSGIQLQVAKNFEIKNIQGADINKAAVKHCKQQGFNCIQSNLFSNIKNKFDIIVFNPPYLPKDKKEDEESKLATTGGKEGSEIINEFLIQAKNHLKKDGKIFLLISSLSENINWLNYKKKLVSEEKLFFEKLEVWELTI